MKLRKAADGSNMTQQQIGEKMGFGADHARKAISRLLNSENDYDPRISTLVAFSQAIKRPLKDLL